LNPRADIDDLHLQGSPNLQRALDREKRDAEEPPLSDEQRDELRRLDALIQKCMDACERGQTVDGKRNPAYANLEMLVKTRRLIRQGQVAEKKQKEPAKGGVEALNEILDKMEKPN
jgi:hypothetical protein